MIKTWSRVLTHPKCSSHIIPILAQLHWSPVLSSFSFLSPVSHLQSSLPPCHSTGCGSPVTSWPLPLETLYLRWQVPQCRGPQALESPPSTSMWLLFSSSHLITSFLVHEHFPTTSNSYSELTSFLCIVCYYNLLLLSELVCASPRWVCAVCVSIIHDWDKTKEQRLNFPHGIERINILFIQYFYKT